MNFMREDFNNEFDLNEKNSRFEEAKRNDAVLFVWDILKIAVISLAIIFPIRYYVVQPFFVKGASMEPNFENNDYILIDEITYRFNELKRGEIIVFRSPENHSQFFIKRIIGLPGETVQIKNGKVFIINSQFPSGFLLDESEYLNPSVRTEGNNSVKLSESDYFVMGDNRTHSSDSRRWGPLDKDLITGRVFVRIWPFSNLDKF